MPFPYPVAPFIRSHHERWDGSGYPDGLRGEETPLGARVLAVVDYFDALSSARPVSRGGARGPTRSPTLQAEAGRALDPSLVALFLAHPADARERVAAEPRPRAERARLGARERAESWASPTSAMARSRWVFHNISLATQEMRALYDIAQTLGTRLSVDDTMALLTSKLSRLVPGSCWVLFLHDAEDDVCAAASPPACAAQTIQRMTHSGGEGPSGWAARHRKRGASTRAPPRTSRPPACR